MLYPVCPCSKQQMDSLELQQAFESYLNSSQSLPASPSEQEKVVSFLHGEALDGICQLLLAKRPVIEADKNLQKKLLGVFTLALERFPENKSLFESISSKEPKFWTLLFPKTSKSVPSSPVKSRWQTPREERKRILECFERAREDQKILKKKNWSRLGRRGEEFDELFENGGQELVPTDLALCRLNEQIFNKINNLEDSQRVPTVSSLPNSNLSSPRKRPRRLVKILDFDALEALFLSLESRVRSAKAVLDAANQLSKSELLFATDFGALKGAGDQPSFNYYRDDDDQTELPEVADSFFRGDELGRFSRGLSYTDASKKFYCQRAHRFRFLSKQPLSYYFPNGLKRYALRDDLFYLKKNFHEFHLFYRDLFETPVEDLFLLVEKQKLMPAMALLAVVFLISPEEKNDFRPINRLCCLRSTRKFGLSWTLQSILEQKGVSGEECSFVSIRGCGSDAMARACKEFKII